jgi:WD40 repeat protein
MRDCQCIFKLGNENNTRFTIKAACLINDNNQLFLIHGIATIFNVYDIKGNKIREIDNYSGDIFFYIDNYYKKKVSKNYIIICSKFMLKSYDFSKNKLYHEYHNMNYSNNNYMINDNDDNFINLIVPCHDNIIRIWDFDSGELLREIKIITDDESLKCFYPWNNEYIVCAHKNNIINVINIQNGKIYKKFVGHKNYILNLQIISLPNIGDCLISQGQGDDQIKLWNLNI